MDTEDLELGRQNARQGVWIGAISLNCPLNYLEGALKTAIAGASQTGGPTRVPPCLTDMYLTVNNLNVIAGGLLSSTPERVARGQLFCLSLLLLPAGNSVALWQNWSLRS